MHRQECDTKYLSVYNIYAHAVLELSLDAFEIRDDPPRIADAPDLVHVSRVRGRVCECGHDMRV